MHDGEQSGTTGQQKRLEQFKVLLFQKPESMSIQYRCNVQDANWTDFRDAGADCGDVGKAIYGVEMRLTNPYQGSVLSYEAHFANVGWLTYASDSPTNNNPILYSPGNRLEALKVNVGNAVAAARSVSGLPAPLGRP